MGADDPDSPHPPATPLTIDKVLQRLAGTAVAMIFLTVVDSVVPPGPARFLVLAAGLVLTVAYLRRSYAISVLGISMVSVIAYAHVDARSVRLCCIEVWTPSSERSSRSW